MKVKAIFFDRDDTLIHDSHYMYKKNQLQFIDGVFEILQKLQEMEYLLFIVTNQSGVGRGYFTIEQMHEFHDYFLEKLLEKNIQIKEIAFCPHAPIEKCDCRKPMPKLINDLCQKYNIDKSQSIMVGDRESDIRAGEAAGVKTFLVENNNLNNLLSIV